MQKKLTITIDENVYAGLHRVIGRGQISQFIEGLVRPHLVHQDMKTAYKEMAEDESRESKALEWAEGTLPDASHESR
jgi:hypothetical protein